jgi:hypothetical protein
MDISANSIIISEPVARPRVRSNITTSFGGNLKKTLMMMYMRELKIYNERK